MKRSRITTFFFLFVITPSIAQISVNYDVATWYQFKKAAVSYTFDDNTANQLPVAIPMFDKYNFKVTLFTVVNWGPNWTGLTKASKNGHEIGSHTLSHPSLNSLSVSDQIPELQNSQNIINANITNTNCITVAYPNCLEGDLATIAKYYIAGRSCQGVVEKPTPVDFYNISSIACGEMGSVKVESDFNNQVIAAKNSNGWTVFLIHAIDNDGGYSSTSSAEIGKHLIYMNNNLADYWVGTFRDVVRYIKERNALSIAETEVDENTIQVTITDNLPDNIYNVPITIRRKLPKGWLNAAVAHDGTTANSSLQTIGGVNYVVFDVVPDHGPYVLTSANLIAGVENQRASDLVTDTNPFTVETTILVNGSFHYAVVGADGRILENGTTTNSVTVGKDLASGLYVVWITRDHDHLAVKIVKK